MASALVTSWQIDGETMETVTDFIFLGSKITADGDCSHEIKRHLLLGRKVMANLDSILTCRDITLPTKVHLVKAMVFSVVMYGCESWTIKKAERRRIDAFELWYWRRLLRVPWTARRSNQSWIFIGRTDAEAESPILWPPDVKNWLIRKDPDAGEDWGQEDKGTTEDEMIGWNHQINGHGFGWTPGVGDGQRGPACCGSWVAKSQTRLNDWTELNSQMGLDLCCLRKGRGEVVDVFQLLSHDRHFPTPWTIAHQVSYSSQSPGLYSNSCPLSQWYY